MTVRAEEPALSSKIAPIHDVGLFVPCLVDQYLPEVGEATVRVLRALGLRVHYERRQTCCGQPAYNAGHMKQARRLAGRTLRLFDAQPVDAIVGPSGSCVSMLRVHAARLDLKPRDRAAWASVAPRIFEVTEFLDLRLGLKRLEGRYPRCITYHASCHLTRELGVRDAPKRFLASLEGVELLPLPDEGVCCGFGGTFSTKLPELSMAMGRDKLDAFHRSGADELVMGDAGCLLQVRGVAKAAGEDPGRIRHIIEVFADAMEAK